MEEYNEMELMICISSRLLEDGSVISVGTGGPCAAAMVAQKLYSPNLLITFEAGAVAPLLPSMPVSVGDSRTMFKAIQTTSMSEIMESLQRGMVDYCFLGGAQIDMYGNLNSTLIGSDYRHPKVRLPGSGGANDFGSLAWRTIVMTPQSSRRFVQKIDFITTPGYLTGPGAREKSGLPPGTGPYKVVTNLAVLGYDEETKRMMIESIHRGITLDDIKVNTGFELLIKGKIPSTEPPTKEELRVLRDEVDPLKLIIGKEAV
ncbi:CoA-transferase subunit beta [Petrotoga sp. 9PWA.NaAc.5.4]|uniref:CoA-transferase subunit beta n=1 Tax=Petrotoga sp. 9PWA.NaAc.5.4 TaxID=1434328 RepID=UPI000CB25C21|nr:CoA-transferase [Petrotoga sp. 9PWA.NaAc.5.4]PNR92278.1 3-oxoacid CoA-transferase [Petrotoga sp. 9PWA.NaAc.5.4]